MSEPKYQILKGDTINFKDPRTGLPVKLNRIIALKNFTSRGGVVQEGEIGGYIQSELNLSHDDSSWVSQLAKVFGKAVLENSYVSGDALVFERSSVHDSTANGKVRIFGDATVIDGSYITDNADVYENAVVQGTRMKNASVICGKARVEFCDLSGGSRISGESIVSQSKLFDQAEIKGKSNIENCHLSGRSVLSNADRRNETFHESIELNVIAYNG